MCSLPQPVAKDVISSIASAINSKPIYRPAPPRPTLFSQAMTSQRLPCRPLYRPAAPAAGAILHGRPASRCAQTTTVLRQRQRQQHTQAAESAACTPAWVWAGCRANCSATTLRWRQQQRQQHQHQRQCADTCPNPNRLRTQVGHGAVIVRAILQPVLARNLPERGVHVQEPAGVAGWRESTHALHHSGWQGNWPARICGPCARRANRAAAACRSAVQHVLLAHQASHKDQLRCALDVADQARGGALGCQAGLRHGGRAAQRGSEQPGSAGALNQRQHTCMVPRLHKRMR